jgi:hypothetical protein
VAGQQVLPVIPTSACRLVGCTVDARRTVSHPLQSAPPTDGPKRPAVARAGVQFQAMAEHSGSTVWLSMTATVGKSATSQAEEFRVVDSEPAFTGDELGVELGDLYRCGVVSMPDLAEHFGDAARGIPGSSLEWSFRRATDVGLVDSGPYWTWRMLADLLVKLTSSTEQSLRDCAENMVRAAKDYAAVDEAAAQEYRERKQRADRELAGRGRQ